MLEQNYFSDIDEGLQKGQIHNLLLVWISKLFPKNHINDISNPFIIVVCLATIRICCMKFYFQEQISYIYTGFLGSVFPITEKWRL